jgi:hypothetical protein
MSEDVVSNYCQLMLTGDRSARRLQFARSCVKTSCHDWLELMYSFTCHYPEVPRSPSGCILGTLK